LGLALACAVAAFFARAGDDGLWSGAWGAFALAGAGLAVVMPQVSYLFIVPALVAGATGIGSALVRRHAPHREAGARFVAVAAPALVPLFLWSPMFFFLSDAFGTPPAPLIAAATAAAATTCTPLVPELDPGPRAILPGALVLAALGVATVAA